MRLFLALFLILVIVAGSIVAVFVFKEQKRTEQAYNDIELATAFLQQGKVEEAVNTLSPIYEDYRRFKAMDQVIYLLATAYEQTGSEHAPLLWRQLSEGYPESGHHDQALLAWAQSLTSSDPAQAKSLVEPLKRSADREIAAAALATQADSLLAEGDIDRARALYTQVLEHFPNTHAEEEAFDKLSEINMKRLFAGGLDEFTTLYEVQRGDSVHKIAIDNHTTKEMVMRLNGIATALRPGQRIKVPNKGFKIVIDKSRLKLFLLTEDGHFVKWYTVAIGEEDYKTPVGVYYVDLKQIDPTWYKPGGGVIPPGDPENALGPRWISIGQHLGIHGNNDRDSVGKRASAGCIRMYNEDVLELYDIVTIGNEVSIVDEFHTATAGEPAGEDISNATEQADEPEQESQP
ncbi:MAG: L,D-transpeptidase family protein [bacterium]